MTAISKMKPRGHPDFFYVKQLYHTIGIPEGVHRSLLIAPKKRTWMHRQVNSPLVLLDPAQDAAPWSTTARSKLLLVEMRKDRL